MKYGISEVYISLSVSSFIVIERNMYVYSKRLSWIHLAGYLLCWLVPPIYPCTGNDQNKTTCGLITVVNPDLIFYGSNVTITFQPNKTHPNTTPKLVNSSNRSLTYQYHDTGRNTFTFSFVVSRKEEHDYYVVLGNPVCYSGTVRICPKEPPAGGNTTPKNTQRSPNNKGQHTVVNDVSTRRSANNKGSDTIANDVSTQLSTNNKGQNAVVNDVSIQRSLNSKGQNTVVSDARIHTTPTVRGQAISNDSSKENIAVQNVLNTSAKNNGLQIIIIATVCAFSVLIISIAVGIAVVCVQRKRQSAANVQVQNTTRVEQVAQEEGYASIGGAECEYAVVNKPKKGLTPQANQTPTVDSKSMEIQSEPKETWCRRAYLCRSGSRSSLDKADQSAGV